MKIVVREERDGEHEAVEALTSRAFGSPGEARLISRLRGLDRVLSLVAEVDGRLAGHILFTPVRILSESGSAPATALGPMAVEPDLQRGGVGSRLVAEGLAACSRAGEKVVFVLGHGEYYPKFGFRPAGEGGFRYKSEQFDPHFFFLELEPGAATGLSGWIEYHEEFDKF